MTKLWFLLLLIRVEEIFKLQVVLNLYFELRETSFLSKFQFIWEMKFSRFKGRTRKSITCNLAVRVELTARKFMVTAGEIAVFIPKTVRA